MRWTKLGDIEKSNLAIGRLFFKVSSIARDPYSIQNSKVNSSWIKWYCAHEKLLVRITSFDLRVEIPRCASGFQKELTASMTLHINGEQREFPDGLTVAALVAQLGIKPDRVAVELNLEIVLRTQWEATALKDGDKLEVVHFVGGGCTGLQTP
jgi:sulfur carrier protein